MKTEHSGHRERLRKRCINSGLDSLEQHEILELLLSYAIPRKDCNKTAHRLIDEFKTISNVFETDIHRLAEIDGVGEASALLISLVPSLTRVYLKDKNRNDVPILSNMDDIGRFALNLFAGKLKEELVLISIDSRRRVRFAGAILKGTVNETPAYPRIVVDEALKHNTQVVVLAHNHPNGSYFPSNNDIEATKVINKALDVISIDLLDHIIVSGQKYFSMAKAGLID